MVVHKYKTIVKRKRQVTSHCGKIFPMAIRQTKATWSDPKLIPPPECLFDEHLVTCHKCIAILIDNYRSKISVLQANREAHSEPSPLP